MSLPSMARTNSLAAGEQHLPPWPRALPPPISPLHVGWTRAEFSPTGRRFFLRALCSSHGERPLGKPLLHGRRPAARLLYSPSHGAPIPFMENQQPPPQLCSTLSSQMAPGVSSRLPRTTPTVPPFLFPHGSSRKPWVTPSLHLPLFPPLDAFHG